MGDQESQDEDFNSIPLEKRITHKSWKARVSAYDDLANRFSAKYDPDDVESYRQWDGNVRKMIKDTHLAALDAGLLCASAYLQNAPDQLVSKTAKDILFSIGDKGLSASRTGTKDKSRQVTMHCIEASNTGEVFVEALMSISEKAKQPKLIATCISTVAEAIRGFGCGVAPPTKTPQPLPPGMVINVRPIVKALPKLFAHADKNVRGEAEKLVVEMQRWVGDGILNALSDLKDVQMKQIKEAIAKWNETHKEPVVPERMTRQQRRDHEAGMVKDTPMETGAEDDIGSNAVAAPVNTEIDPWEMTDPVEILPKIQRSTLDALTKPKWSDRRDALNELNEITSTLRIKPDRYGELAAALAKRVSSDAHIMCVTIAVKTIGGLARGLRKDFAPYKSQVLPALLGKLKEKKESVLTELKGALDAVFASTSLSDIINETLEHMGNKNPNIRTESTAFLMRCLKDTTVQIPKDELKKTMPVLLKVTEDTDKNVREAGMDTVAVLSKLVGERILAPYMEKVDDLRKAKIKEKAEAVEIKFKRAEPKKPAAKKGTSAPEGRTVGLGANRGVNGKARSGGAPTAVPTKVDFGPTPVAKAVAQPDVADLSALDPAILAGLADPSWQKRKSTLEQIRDLLQTSPRPIKPHMGEFLPLFKQRLSDSNKSIIPTALDLVGVIAESMGKNFERHLPQFMDQIIHSVGDSKIHIRNQAVVTITRISDSLGLDFILQQLSAVLVATESPTVRKDLLRWISERPKDKIATQPMHLLTGIVNSSQHRDPGVRRHATASLQWLTEICGEEHTMRKVTALKPPNLKALQQIIASVQPSPAAESPMAQSPNGFGEEPMEVDTGGLGRAKNGRRPMPGARKRSAVASGTRAGQPALGISVPEATDQQQMMPGTRMYAPQTAPMPMQGMQRMALAPNFHGMPSSAVGLSAHDLTEVREPPIGSPDFALKDKREENCFRFQRWIQGHLHSDASGSSASNSANESQGVGGTLFDLLHDQMIGAGFGADICMQAFSHNAQEQLQAMQTLEQYMQGGLVPHDDVSEEAHGVRMSTIAASDLIFKYSVMRLLETSATNMNLKCLDLVERLCTVLDREGGHMMDREASIAVPALILRVGDPKEPIRVRIRAILLQVTRLFSSTKIFTYLMDIGRDSRNGRTRAETLEMASQMLSRYGMPVIQHIPKVYQWLGQACAMDRDPAVRQAALNGLVIITGFIGVDDLVSKCLVRLGPRERTAVEEKLRKSRVMPAALQVPQHSTDGLVLGQPRRLSYQRNPASPVRSPQRSPQMRSPVRGFPNSPIAAAPTQMRPQYDGMAAANMAQYQHSQLGYNNSRRASRSQDPQDIPMMDAGQGMVGSIQEDDGQLGALAQQLFATLAESNPKEQIECLKTIDHYFASSSEFMTQYCDTAVREVVAQMRLAMSEAPHRPGDEEHDRLCRQLISTLVQIFSKPAALFSLRPESLHGLLQELLNRLLEDFGPTISRPLNVLMIRVLENVDRNVMFGALLQILSETSMRLRYIDESKYAELVMKCLWKLTKTLQDNLRNARLTLGPLLNDVNDFFRRASPSEWRKRIEERVILTDMPLRTVKTIVHEVVSCVGHEAVWRWIREASGGDCANFERYLRSIVDRRTSQADSSQLSGSRVNGDGSSPPQQAPLSPVEASQPMGNHLLTPQGYNRFDQNEKRASPPTIHRSLPPSFAAMVDAAIIRVQNKNESKAGMQDLLELRTMQDGAGRGFVDEKISSSFAGTFFANYVRRTLDSMERSSNSPIGGTGGASVIAPTAYSRPSSGGLEHGHITPASHASSGGMVAASTESYVPHVSAAPSREPLGLDNAGGAHTAYRERLSRLRQRVRPGSATAMEGIRPASGADGASYGITETGGAVGGMSSEGHSATISDLKKRLERMKQTMKENAKPEGLTADL